MIEQVLKLKDVNLHIIDIIYANHYIGNWGHNSWQWIQGAAQIPVNQKRLEFIRGLSTNPPSNVYFLTIDHSDTNPHAFQDLLAETIPTLCYSIPAYSAFINMWENLRDENWEWEHITQPGLDKIEEYQACLVDKPAYVLDMGETSIFQWIANLILYIGIDPKNKLSFYCEQSQEKYDIAKAMFIEAVSYNDYFLQVSKTITSLK